MQHKLRPLLEGYDSISLVGMCKNAGKTTVLNRCLSEFWDSGETLALTSIGRDGEDTDLVTGTEKPGIYVKSGTLLATAAGLLAQGDITREILQTTGLYTPLGEVVILRALSDGKVQLAGPSIVAHLAQVRDSFFALGAGRVFIDGAISRKTLATRALSRASILCTGASCGGSMEDVVAETAHFTALALLPEVAAEDKDCLPAEAGTAKYRLLGNEAIDVEGGTLAEALRHNAKNNTRLLFVEGALTDAMVAPFIRSRESAAGVCLVVRDASKLLLSRKNTAALATRGCTLAVLDSVNLVAVTVNPFSAYGTPFEGDDFRAAMAAAVPLPVFDVEETT